MRLRLKLVNITTICAMIFMSPSAGIAGPMDGTGISPIIITEVQTGGSSASEEFVELFNTSDSPVDIAGWQLRYLGTGGDGQATTLLATIGSVDGPPVVLDSGKYYVLHSSSVSLPDGVQGQTYTAKLTKTDKTIALFAYDQQFCQMVVQDAVAWESTSGGTMGEGLAAPVTSDQIDQEKLLQRWMDQEGNYSDTNNNAHDFVLAAGTPGQDNPNFIFQETEGSPSTLPSFVASGCIVDDKEPEQADPETDLEEPVQEDLQEQEELPDQPDETLLPLELTELLPNPVGTDTGNEYVEIYNPNDTPVNLLGFKLEAGTKYGHEFTQDDNIGPGEYHAFFSTVTLVNSTSQVRLIAPDGQAISETAIYTGVSEGQAWSLVSDVWQWGTPSPNLSNQAAPIEESEPESGDDIDDPQNTDNQEPVPGSSEENQQTTPPENTGLQSPQLSELLPNPGSGLSDSEDEFVELYNPNDKAFNLAGYVIETGLTAKKRYTVPSGISIQPRSYLALFSSDTDNGTLLVNSGGQVSLFDPSGNLLSQTKEYSTAKDDYAWALIGGQWIWTLKPTPNGPNIAQDPIAQIASAKAKMATTKKTTATKAAAKTPKTSTAKPVKESESEQSLATATSNSSPIHPWVLAAIAGSALLYGLYEYRHDIANKFHQLRGNRTIGGALGSRAKGR